MNGRRVFYFDGGCHPNPGPIEVAVVAGGAVHFHDGAAHGDNNEAEWLALLKAVHLAIATGAQDALFIGDSALVIGQASGKAKCRSHQLRSYKEAFLEAVTAIPRVRFRRVPRSKNLAGIALARRRSGRAPAGRGPAMSR